MPACGRSVVRRAGLLAVALVVPLVAGAPLALGTTSAAARPAGPVAAVHAKPVPRAARLDHRGRTIVDGTGRVVTIHGINAVWKYAPYVAPDDAKGFTARDADFLVRNGFNAVRLGVLFAGVMPHQDKVDQGYLTKVDRIVRLLSKRHIWVLLDFHQDAYNEKFDGEGFPSWAVHDDGLPFQDAGSFFANYQTPALERTFDHFWNDDFHLVDRYANAWRAVARRFRDTPYLMGYDLFNEPSAGSEVATCANPAGCPAFDHKMQRDFDRIRRVIRQVDTQTMVWFEPQFYFNAISKGNFTHVADKHVGLSWHDYACTPAFVQGGVLPGDPDCIVNEPRVMDNAGDQADRMGAGSVLTEFGAGDDLEDLGRLTQLADDRLTGWMYWAYKTWDDPTGSPDEGLYAQDEVPGSLKVAKLKTLERPYAQLTAGVPQSYTWDPATRVMRFKYRADMPGATRFFVPSLIYPHGYTMRLSNAHHAGDETTRNPRLVADSAGPVLVTIRPR